MADEETTETISEDETTAAETEETTASSETGSDPAGEPDWKQQSRKHERRAKEAAKRAEQAEAKLKELEQAGASETEKAIAKAREEAAAQAKAEALAELRGDRLEVAVTRLANGIKVKDGDEEKELRFADPDDAILHIERAIKAGDVDEDDIFNSEGRVQTDALKDALADILRRKRHLIAATTNGNGRVAGSADGGKGAPGKSIEDASADEIFESIQRTKK